MNFKMKLNVSVKTKRKYFGSDLNGTVFLRAFQNVLQVEIITTVVTSNFLGIILFNFNVNMFHEFHSYAIHHNNTFVHILMQICRWLTKRHSHSITWPAKSPYLNIYSRMSAHLWLERLRNVKSSIVLSMN